MNGVKPTVWNFIASILIVAILLGLILVIGMGYTYEFGTEAAIPEVVLSVAMWFIVGIFVTASIILIVFAIIGGAVFNALIVKSDEKRAIRRVERQSEIEENDHLGKQAVFHTTENDEQ